MKLLRSLLCVIVGSSLYCVELGAVEAAPLTGVQVLDVQPKRGTGRIQLGDTIRVTVTNVLTLQEAAKQSNRRIVLFLDGMEMTNVIAEGFISTTNIDFHLQRMNSNKRAWDPIFREPFLDDTNVRRVEANVGLAGG